MNDTLYSDKFEEISEIYKLNDDIESESESSYLQDSQGWSQISSVQREGQSLFTNPESQVGQIDKIEAAGDSENSDLRPHYFDPVLKQSFLVDSGSQVTALPPDPGDIEDKSVRLRAVNGTIIKTYGFKEFSLKINRKSYPFKAIKAQVDKPVLGWDFMREHRLDLRWGQWGDLMLYDKKAKIKGICEIKPVPILDSDKHKKLHLEINQ